MAATSFFLVAAGGAYNLCGFLKLGAHYPCSRAVNTGVI